MYGDAHWYFHYGAYLFIGLVILIGLGCYYGIVRRRPEATLAEHAAPADAAGVQESELPSAGLLAPRP